MKYFSIKKTENNARQQDGKQIYFHSARPLCENRSRFDSLTSYMCLKRNHRTAITQSTNNWFPLNAIKSNLTQKIGPSKNSEADKREANSKTE